jgi:O-antigen/teichoic acid export membrane protein
MAKPPPLTPPSPAAPAPPATDARERERIVLRGRSLREHTARGTVVNAVFLVALNFVGLAKGFVVAGFLTRSDYGVWGILLVTLATFGGLKQIGVNDKFVQQSEPDQELAFQRFFTMELILSGGFWLLMLAVPPIAALVYGQPRLIVPGLVMTMIVPLAVLQTPVWVYYRRMDFVRQRSLQAIDPLLSFAVTVTLAIAGAGYWSLIAGAVTGVAAASVMAARFAPYRFALRFDRQTLREYTRFSLPLLVAALSALVIGQGSLLVGEQELGLAAAGAISLAAAIAVYAERVDQIVTTTLYPAICAVRDRSEALFEAFVKSNRLALMWGAPFGVAVALFAGDLVSFGIGERWRPAVGLIQAFGLIAAVNHVGFNWHAFFRARGETRPIAAWSLLCMLAFLAAVPALTASHGLHGFALGMAAMTTVSLVVRAYYLTRLFPAFAMLRHGVRALAPIVPAAVAVLATRALEGSHRSLATAIGEFVLYVVLTVAATLLLERPLLREMIGYLRPRVATEPRVAA